MDRFVVRDQTSCHGGPFGPADCVAALGLRFVRWRINHQRVGLVINRSRTGRKNVR